MPKPVGPMRGGRLGRVRARLLDTLHAHPQLSCDFSRAGTPVTAQLNSTEVLYRLSPGSTLRHQIPTLPRHYPDTPPTLPRHLDTPTP
eukprot:scaffold6560_cov60-Phaeocystis_antarctica.AAC.4